MYYFGSHVSCQGGILCGIDRAVEVGCNCLQIFVCQPRQWPSPKSCITVSGRAPAAGRAPVAGSASVQSATTPPLPTNPLTPEDLLSLQQALTKHNLPAPLAHASYLINLGSLAADQWDKSIAALGSNGAEQKPCSYRDWSCIPALT